MALSLAQKVERDYNRELESIQAKIDKIQRSLDTATYLSTNMRIAKEQKLAELQSHLEVQKRKGLGGIFRTEPSSIG